MNTTPLIPKKVELCNSIFLVLLKIEVFPFFFRKFEKVELLYGPNKADIDIYTKKDLVNFGSNETLQNGLASIVLANF